MNNKIQRSFSQSAKQYDRFSSLHREIADQLLGELVKEPAPSVILDVGCGTGYLTLKLKEQFLQSKVKGLDFAQGMLDVARLKSDGIEWIWADGNNLPLADASCDLVISNLAYQWAEDLAKSFSDARRVLKEKGILAATLFGYNTCQELFQCLDEARGKSHQFSRLPDLTQVRAALDESGFKYVSVNGEQMKIEFKDMRELMSWLKSIGANNLSGQDYLGAQVLGKAAAIYQSKFPYSQGVLATFEVIKIYAKA